MSIIEIYVEEFEARLFPLRQRRELGNPDAKKPLITNWRERNFREKTLLKYWTEGHAIGWALSPFDLVIDVDAPTDERPDKQGIQSLKKLSKILGGSLDNETVEVVAPSGGRHFYFQKPADVAIRKTIDSLPDIEFLSAGAYVVIAGSPHWQGGTYAFSDFTTLIGDYRRSEAPSTLLNLIGREKDLDFEAAGIEGIPGTMLTRMLDELDATNYRDHNSWFNIFAASHSATGGSLDGREAFVNWSISDSLYVEHGDNIRERWGTLKDRPDGLTIATLFDELNTIGRSNIVRLVQAALEFQGVEIEMPERNTIAEIDYGLNEVDVNNAVIKSLTKAPNLFQRAGSLVSIGDSGIAPVGPVSLVELASEVCTLTKETRSKKGVKVEPLRIPERVGRQIVARGSWFGVKTLRSITPIPVMTADGILQTPGYDLRSGVFYRKTVDVKPVASNPSRDDARAALARLADLVVDFPFNGAAHRSVWLAGLLALVARPAIDGPIPLIFISGNQAGVGKSLLVDIINLIGFGVDASRMSMSKDDEEIRKSVLGLALRSQAVALFDNLGNGTDFGSPVLDAVLTSRSVSDRVLGKSQIVDAEIDTIFFATGNRLGISKNSDSFRRVAFINLIYDHEDPKSREDFKHGGETALKQMVLRNRAELIHDALTVLQAARVAELPEVPAWGSYSAFSDTIRRALVWLGEPDPIETRNELEIFNEDVNELATVVGGLRAVIGVGVRKTSGEILTTLRQISEFGEDKAEADIAAGTLEVLAPGFMKSPETAIGKRLKSRFRDRPHDGYWIKADADKKRKQLVYFIERIEE